MRTICGYPAPKVLLAFMTFGADCKYKKAEMFIVDEKFLNADSNQRAIVVTSREGYPLGFSYSRHLLKPFCCEVINTFAIWGCTGFSARR